jgi:hypothetical protein
MPVPLRADFDARSVRAAAKHSKDGPQARRPLALASGASNVNIRSAATTTLWPPSQMAAMHTVIHSFPERPRRQFHGGISHCPKPHAAHLGPLADLPRLKPRQRALGPLRPGAYRAGPPEQ